MTVSPTAKRARSPSSLAHSGVFEYASSAEYTSCLELCSTKNALSMVSAAVAASRSGLEAETCCGKVMTLSTTDDSASSCTSGATT